jgi:serine/threonine-protein kinase
MSSIFISHATEDKDAVARPIASALRDCGYEVWYDEYSLKLGDNLRREIDHGLASCTFGVVVLSKSFFAKEWPQKEMDALTCREASEGGKILLPVWHQVSSKEIARFSPMLAGRLGARTERGLENVVDAIKEAVGTPGKPVMAMEASQPLVYSFPDQNVLDWRDAIQRIFKGNRPKSNSWIKPDEIVEVLSHVVQENLNHCYFPTGGGMDLEDVRPSAEEGCIELIWTGRMAAIIRPRILQFEYFPGFPSLSYFRIEADLLKPVGGIEPDAMYERLTEISPGEYREAWVWDSGCLGCDESGAEIPLPDDARKISRYFRGSFAVFAKGSLYNRLSDPCDAYDANHHKLGAKDFREFISTLIGQATSAEIELEPDRR